MLYLLVVLIVTSPVVFNLVKQVRTSLADNFVALLILSMLVMNEPLGTSIPCHLLF